MNTPEQSQLGKASAYADQYDPSLLFPIPRSGKREEIGISGALPFFGADLWTAFELSWLNARGKPQVALAHFTIPCETPHIIESKSFKLYLNSFNNSRFDSLEAVQERLREDVNEALWRGAAVRQSSASVRVIAQDAFELQKVQELQGLNLDRLDIECSDYTPRLDLLKADHDNPPVTETLVSHLLKSNCLVTGQPDWGMLVIRYRGRPIDRAGLLRYIVSFRKHNEFHEQCVERIYCDLQRQCAPEALAVHARYTRRGGLDINPFRSSGEYSPPANIREIRQ